MKKVERTITSNKIQDKLLISFPLWFPLLYILINFNFPAATFFLFIASIFILRETHFGSTWLFFFDRDNWKWLRENSYNLFFIPIYSLVLVFFVWTIVPSAVIIFHYLASGWHVTRQSVGIQKVYGLVSKTWISLTYFVSAICLFIGLSKPGIIDSSILSKSNFNLILIVALIIYFSFIYLFRNSDNSFLMTNIMTFFTGISIFLPLLFFKNLAIGTTVGVGMHWIQYLAIMWSNYIRKSKDKSTAVGNEKYPKSLISRLSFILLYGLIMTFLTVKGMPQVSSDSNDYSTLYLIPIIFQLYHFYIDGFIWRFSDPHIKKQIGTYMFN
tara:strand:- start:11987 stop:12967 length:981 start_codon:yes stop_codon:yes gene_type:complete